jgi:putative ABC transport system permease protein
MSRSAPVSTPPPAPPRLARRLLSRLTRYDEEFAVQGDLAEEFVERSRTSGYARAAFWYRRQVFFAAASYVLYSIQIGVDMFNNIMKIALRTMAKFKFYTLINLLGLAVGLALSLLALLYVRYEFSFDDFHERPQDIYRIVSHQSNNVYQGNSMWARSPAFLGETMKREFPEVELAARVSDQGATLRVGEKVFLELKILCADPDFMKIFRIPVLDGQGADALAEPFTIWPTRDMARKYFGTENPVGKTILYDNKFLFRVAGVVENCSVHSHLGFDFIASLTSLPEIFGGDYGKAWLQRTGSLDFTTYIRLRPGADPAALEKNLPSLQKKFENPSEMPPEMRNRFFLQPLRRVHLYSQFNFDIASNTGDIRTVTLITAIGFVILLIACFNFMNLSTARSAVRAKEIGVRKVLGSERKDLRLQFFGESLLFSVLSAGMAVLMVKLLLPAFNALLGRTIEFSLLARPDVILSGGAIVLFVALVSGAYPAFLLSSWSPVPILKGAAQSGGRKTSVLRNALVCFQFTASIALLACTFVINAQMRFVRDKNLGFAKDHILSFFVREGTLQKNTDAFRAEILNNPRVLDFTTSQVLPSYIGSGGPQKMNDGREFVFYRAYGDYRFLEFFNMPLIMGRNFSPDHPSDEKDAVILNETAAKALGWKDPLGKVIKTDGPIKEGRIIGVVRDFHFHPLRQPIMPLWIKLSPRGNGYFSIKIDSRDVPATLRFLEGVLKKFFPNSPFTYRFMDERLERMYADERAFSKLFLALSFLAAFLACLGLVGLSAFTAERRMKEIGIRRVLGASVSGIVAVLARGFLKWVLLAAVAAFPIAWLAAKSWLNRFAYRIDVGWVPLLSSLGLALALAFVSVVVQSVRAASADPVRSLRNE